MGRLYIVAENLANRERETHELDTPRITIGRGAHTDVTIRDPSLMDVHAIIEINGGQAQFVHFDGERDAIVDGQDVPAKRLLSLNDPSEVTLNESVRLRISTRAPERAIPEHAPPSDDGAVPELISSADQTLSIPIRLDSIDTKDDVQPAPPLATTTDVPSWSTEAAPQATAIRADPSANVKTAVLAPGMRIAENYEVVRQLGVGGMGAVYKGIDHRRRREIAIKVIAPSHVSSPNALGRFEREVAAAAAVRHPNIAEIYDSGVSDGMPFIVMQYVRGDDLATVLERERLEIPRAVDLMLSLCAAVQAVHDRNVVHRDLKPENVKVVKERRGETAVLLDFGVAKVIGSHPFFGADPKLTAADAIVGSVEYMAPEQTSGSPHADFAVDQYAIGVILYRCLTQRLPFEGPNALALIRKIIDGVFDSPSVHRPEIPDKLEAVILKALSRYPEDRFSSVDKLGEALLAFASERGRRLWMDELTAPNRPQLSGAIASTAVSPRAAEAGMGAAGGTLFLPGARDPKVARTQLLPAPGFGDGAPDDGADRPARSRQALIIRVALIAGGMVAIALAAGFIARELSSRGPAHLATPRTPAPRSGELTIPAAPSPGENVSAAPSRPIRTLAPTAVADPSLEPRPAPTTSPRPAPAPTKVAERPPEPRPASTSSARPARKPKVHRQLTPKVEAAAPPPLPTETPNHVKLIY